jgi:CheY-like chemotaxis protein
MALHRPLDDLPKHAELLGRIHDTSTALAGKKVLIVDDDARNIFALATLLEDHGMDVVSASSGRDALRVLKEHNNALDIVLMDIMMPDMDGIATIRAAREISSCRELQFIAFTAKALKGDRERCIEAGAWDYIAKPVDAGSLLAVMRSWLYR